MGAFKSGLWLGFKKDRLGTFSTMSLSPSYLHLYEVSLDLQERARDPYRTRFVFAVLANRDTHAGIAIIVITFVQLETCRRYGGK